jgi:hypothetical protein
MKKTNEKGGKRKRNKEKRVRSPRQEKKEWRVKKRKHREDSFESLGFWPFSQSSGERDLASIGKEIVSNVHLITFEVDLHCRKPRKGLHRVICWSKNFHGSRLPILLSFSTEICVNLQKLSLRISIRLNASDLQPVTCHHL